LLDALEQGADLSLELVETVLGIGHGATSWFFTILE
jgi:hypothetical protein